MPVVQALRRKGVLNGLVDIDVSIGGNRLQIVTLEPSDRGDHSFGKVITSGIAATNPVRSEDRRSPITAI